MINGRKIIGVCMTKIHYTTRSRLIDHLRCEAWKHGYKLIIFNNSFDFDNGEYSSVSEGIYDFINFDIIDALVIMCSGFSDKNVYKRIIDRAKENNTPVILEDDEAEGCYTVRNSFEDTFEKLLNHVIREHGVSDTFFIAGIRNNEYSERRIRIYKKVLADNGLEFRDDMLDYGDFWQEPTYGVIKRLMNSGRKLPQAIFCANDAMAIAACNALAEYGVRVPDDVIVTGLDGSKLSEFTVPKISTCVSDLKGFAEKMTDVVKGIFDGSEVEKLNFNYYSLRLCTSCGCSGDDETDFRQIAEENYNTTLNLIGHEHYVYNQIMSIMNMDKLDINSFYGALSSIIHETSLFALNPSFFQEAAEDKAVRIQPSDMLVTITSDKLQADEASRKKSFIAADMIPEKEKWAENDSVYIINQVHTGKIICGYYECVTSDVPGSANMINRVLNLINMIVHMAVSDLRQRLFKLRNNDETMVEPITELANLHGATYWFEQICSGEKKPMTVSVYEIPKYKYIYEKYGLNEVEATLCFIAESLRIANPNNSFIAHAAENTFVVINRYNNAEEITPAINSATTVFYGLLDKYNRTNGKEYYTEVDAGCTVVSEYKLETCIYQATNELYRNKLIYGTRSVDNPQQKSSKEKYELFNALIYNNLFSYHFQPIVSAVTGEIYGYEALMRTDKSIGFNPLEVISIAAEYQRLYDIEKATLFNVMERFKTDRESFRGRKVFINSIPGYFLNNEDNKKLCEEYSELIGNFVFEITEQNSITDEELNNIRSIGNSEGNNPIAVDDYGTGHSNVVNLFKYSPEIVKIDRFLMTDIHKDETKQLVVKNVIDFARLNNIKVLAEGIETEDELRKVISMGVDYIQGYYTGRPVYEPVAEINADIRKVITDAAAERMTEDDMLGDIAFSREEEQIMKLICSLKANGRSIDRIVNRINSL